VQVRALRLAKKVAAGAEFIQTQSVYNLERFEQWMRQVVDMGLHEKVSILAGVTPLKSAGMAAYIKHKVPGMDLPDALLERIKGVPKEKQGAAGIKICIETIERLKEIPGVKGVHIMAIEWEAKVREIVQGANLLPRP
jgi:methylenetetrahydrofolate reductase (NADPH)